MERALAFAALLWGYAAAGRPILPEPPLGTGSAAFLEAGRAAGASAVLANPGALSIAAGSEIELGVMGLSRDPSPYSLFGGRSGPWSYSAGGFYDQRLGPFRGGMVAGGAREVAPGASVGAAVRSQGGLDGYGVDADAGLLLSPRGPGFFGDWAVLGLAVRNLAESGLGQEPEGYRTPRSYTLSAAARKDAARILLLPAREPEIAYEFRAEGMRNAGLSHLFSACAAFTPSGALTLRAGLRLPHEGSAEAAAGGSLRFALGSGSLTCGYAFAGGGEHGGQTHSMSATLAFGSRVDRRPPRVSVRADRVYLGADSPGHDRVHFSLRARDVAAGGAPAGEDPAAEGGRAASEGREDPEEAVTADGPEAAGRGELGGWSLDILATDGEGRRGRAVRSFRGMDLPPRLIRWDGRGEDGGDLAPGFYAFRLSAADKAGNRSETAWQLVELGPPPSRDASPGGRPHGIGAAGTAAGSGPAAATQAGGSAREAAPDAPPMPEAAPGAGPGEEGGADAEPGGPEAGGTPGEGDAAPVIEGEDF